MFISPLAYLLFAMSEPEVKEMVKGEKWDYFDARGIAGGVYRIKAKADKKGVIWYLELEEWGPEWTAVKTIHNYDEGILLQFAEGPKPDQLRVKASAVLEIKPERRPSWLNLQILRATSDRIGFLETLRLISKDLESMILHEFHI
jgi:hypothetical protein